MIRVNQKTSFLDKTKRDSPDTQEFRMKLLKRSAPGGLPAQIPARTTLISATQWMVSTYRNGDVWGRKGSQIKAFGVPEPEGHVYQLQEPGSNIGLDFGSTLNYTKDG